MFFILFFTLFAAAQNVHAASSPVSDALRARVKAEETYISELTAYSTLLGSEIQALSQQQLYHQHCGNAYQQWLAYEEYLRLVNEYRALQHKIIRAVANQTIIDDGSIYAVTGQIAKDQAKDILVLEVHTNAQLFQSQLMAAAAASQTQSAATRSVLPTTQAVSSPASRATITTLPTPRHDQSTSTDQTVSLGLMGKNSTNEDASSHHQTISEQTKTPLLLAAATSGISETGTTVKVSQNATEHKQSSDRVPPIIFTLSDKQLKKSYSNSDLKKFCTLLTEEQKKPLDEPAAQQIRSEILRLNRLLAKKTQKQSYF